MPKSKTFLWGRDSLETEDDGGSLYEFALPKIKAKDEEESKAAKIEDGIDSVAKDPVDDNESAEDDSTPAEKEALRYSWANERFGGEIAKRKNATGVIILYADDEYYDNNRLRNFVEQGRIRIANEAKIKVSRLQVVFGGYRSIPVVEFWIVPANAEMPTAMPETRETGEDEHPND
ncbi:MAG: hypothetical protein ABJB40_05540 [Acidobacteriota bacterium]